MALTASLSKKMTIGELSLSLIFSLLAVATAFIAV